jgi:hypothetical protein
MLQSEMKRVEKNDTIYVVGAFFLGDSTLVAWYELIYIIGLHKRFSRMTKPPEKKGKKTMEGTADK